MKKRFSRIFCIVVIISFIFPLTTGTIHSMEESESIQFEENNKLEYAPGQFIVKLKKDLTFDTPSIHALNNKHQVFTFEEIFPNTEGTVLDNIYLLHIPIESDILSTVQNYMLSPDIVYAEPNRIAELCSIPNDANFSKQWYLHNTGQVIYGNTSGTPDADIDAPEVWDLEKGSSDVIIAIIDTGIDYTHPDLASKIWNNADEIANNLIDDDNNGYIDDVRGWNFDDNNSDPIDDYCHGTICAGLAGAVTDNGIGIAGSGGNCTVMPIKTSNLLTSEIAKGIKYATDNGANIISMSFGYLYPVKIVKDLVNYAYDNGVFLCASAGNGNVPQRRYPAVYAQVVAVAATNQNDERCTPKDWGFILYGSTYGHWVDIAAPGHLIYSITPSYHLSFNDMINPITGKNNSQYYDYVGWGTSFSCPLVAGIAALLLSVDPSLTPGAVKTLLCKNVDPYYSLFYIGTGRLNAYKALADLLSDIDVNLSGGFGVEAIISNHGLMDVTHIDWRICVKGGIFGLINKTMNGTIDLQAGESKTVSTGIFFGYGSTIIDVKVDIVEKTMKGIQFSFFSLLK